MNLETFTEQEIPYRTLAKFGLTQEMIDDLPENVKNFLLTSRWTMRLPVVMENDYGEKFLAKARIRLIRLSNGMVDVIFAPYCETDSFNEYNEDQQAVLKKGRVIITDVNEHQCYVQFDKDLNQTMSVPVELIMQNIDILADQFGIDDTDKEYIAKGEIATLTQLTKPVSIGVDLKEESGLRIIPGTVQEWVIGEEENVEKYTIGVYGTWIRDEVTSDMDYVLENDYTEDIMQEIERRKLQSYGREMFRR